MLLAEHDIMYPDQLLALNKLEESGTVVESIKGAGMPHIWPLLPVMKEARMALNKIIDILNKRA